MKSNVKLRPPPVRTHEGAKASKINAFEQLRRSVMATFLWEDSFYEDGESIATRIKKMIPLVEPELVMNLAIEARTAMNLRHVPLLIVREMARLPEHKNLVSLALEQIIQRPDELAEFLSIYWKEGKTPISAQVKKGLAKAFMKFNEYSLAKYNRDEPIKLRDVAMLTKVKPGTDKFKGRLFANLINKSFYPEKTSSGFAVKKTYGLNDYQGLEVPDTWEVELSANGNNAESWARLITEDKLGALALLRNLRNMHEKGVDPGLIKMALEKMNTRRVLPFRFIAAARHSPVHFQEWIEQAMLRTVMAQPKFEGPTAVVIDHSRSMDAKVSSKSEITRFEAAAGLAMFIRERCDNCRVFTYSDTCIEIAPRRGFAMLDALNQVRNPTATYLGRAVLYIRDRFPDCERTVVITDEQTADDPGWPLGKGYIINVSNEKNGIGYGTWTHIDGWSDAILDYMYHFETGFQ